MCLVSACEKINSWVCARVAPCNFNLRLFIIETVLSAEVAKVLAIVYERRRTDTCLKQSKMYLFVCLSKNKQQQQQQKLRLHCKSISQELLILTL